jgi:hypothetical protein
MFSKNNNIRSPGGEPAMVLRYVWGLLEITVVRSNRTII